MSALPPRPNLEQLKRQARELLEAYRSGEAHALARIRAHPGHSAASDAQIAQGPFWLRDAQLVIAREYGLRSWAELRAHVERGELDLAGCIAAFLDLACLVYGGGDSPRRRTRAQRLLEESPEIVRTSIHTAAAVGDAKSLRRMLDADPSLATSRGGPRDWDPLLYLCYARVRSPDPAHDSLAAARLLLERGADPNTYTLLNDRHRFTALTGAMGEGEAGLANQPPHAHAVPLARLLLAAGADPNDSQGLYNTCFQPSNAWIELLLEHGLRADHRVNWMTDSPTPPRMLDFLLGHAARNGLRDRVELLLARGADPAGRDSYNQRPNHTNAMLAGHLDLAAQLERHGAVPQELTASERFRVAVLAADAKRVHGQLVEHPELLPDAQLLLDAADHGHTAAVHLMLDLGVPVDARSPQGVTPLHQAAWRGHEALVRLLVEHGAPLEVRDQLHGSTPVGWASHGAGSWTGRSSTLRVLEYLLERTSDVVDLAAHGRATRLSEVLDGDSSRVAERDPAGNTGLHLLSDETPDLDAVIDVLLRHGADLEVRNQAGLTPLERAQRDEQTRVSEALQRRRSRALSE